MFTATTSGIKITVQPFYLENQSDSKQGVYVWAYTVHVQNLSGETVQLLNRYWHITDARGMVEEVRGPGVVGVQPMIKPNESFQYTSGASLHTASGIMQGSYEMRDSDGQLFQVVIPAFSLDSTEQLARPN